MGKVMSQSTATPQSPTLLMASHSITVYANSTFGIIGASKNIDFTVKPAVKSEPLTSMIVILVSATVIAIVIGSVAAILY